MSKGNRILTIAGLAIVAFSVTVMIMTACVTADTDEIIAEADAFLEAYETHKIEASMKPEYSWQEQLLAKITGFEVGNTGCAICMHYVASACINRMYEWYGGDPVAMVTDGNDEYYYMNPDYADPTCIEVNGWNYFEHANYMLKVVKEAEQRTADCWYWDCSDSQRDWAELIFYCPTDHMYYYR